MAQQQQQQQQQQHTVARPQYPPLPQQQQYNVMQQNAMPPPPPMSNVNGLNGPSHLVRRFSKQFVLLNSFAVPAFLGLFEKTSSCQGCCIIAL